MLIDIIVSLPIIILRLISLFLVLLALLASHLFTHYFFLYLHLLIDSSKFILWRVILFTLLCAPTRSDE